MVVVGTFGNLDAERAQLLTAGTAIAGVGDDRRDRRSRCPQPTRVFARPASSRSRSTRRCMCRPMSNGVLRSVRTQGMPECVGGGIVLQPTTMLFVDTPLGKLPFQIDQIRGSQPLERGRR